MVAKVRFELYPTRTQKQNTQPLAKIIQTGNDNKK